MRSFRWSGSTRVDGMGAEPLVWPANKRMGRSMGRQAQQPPRTGHLTRRGPRFTSPLPRHEGHRRWISCSKGSERTGVQSACLHVWRMHLGYAARRAAGRGAAACSAAREAACTHGCCYSSPEPANTHDALAEFIGGDEERDDARNKAHPHLPAQLGGGGRHKRLAIRSQNLCRRAACTGGCCCQGGCCRRCGMQWWASSSCLTLLVAAAANAAGGGSAAGLLAPPLGRCRCCMASLLTCMPVAAAAGCGSGSGSRSHGREVWHGRRAMWALFRQLCRDPSTLKGVDVAARGGTKEAAAHFSMQVPPVA